MELQDIDDQLAIIESKKGSLPQRVEKLETSADELSTELTEAESTLAEYQKELHGIEGSLMDGREKLKKYQDQLYLVTTNREYDALTNEIETVKTDMEEQEERQLILEGEIEDISSRIDTLKTDSGKLSDDLNKNRTELSDKTAETEATQSDLEAKRGELVKGISQRYLRKYERILKARRQAVVKVQRDACGGCHKHLSPQRLFEIRQMDALIECENCGRILVYVEKKED